MIIPLDHERARERATTGGKASALARLLAAGFPVPNGVVVTSPSDIGDALHDAIAGLLDHGAHSLAVRSSGFAEDSSAASYAGQFETFLDVRSVEDAEQAIARCFASFADSRASAYRSAIAHDDATGAVLVQRLVRATSAGVAFSRDPLSGDSDRIIIDAAAGLGDAVVGGRVTPDGFVVSGQRDTIVERRVAAAVSALDDDQVRAVARLARAVEAHEGAPIDIEWAFEGDRLFLLQARPITAIATRPPTDWTPELDTTIDPRFPLYSSGNVGEILPGCVTPLTYSLFSRGVELAFRDLMQSLGSMTDVGPAPVVVGFFHHRVYLNVSYFMAAADNSPGSSRSDVYEELIGPPPERHPAFTTADLLPWNLWRGLRIVTRFLAMQGRLAADIAAVRATLDRLLAQFASAPPEQWTNESLAAWVEVDDAALQPGIVHIRASQFASTAFSALRKLSRTALNDTDGSVAATVVTGIGTLASADPAVALHAMARIVRDDPWLAESFARERDDDALLVLLAAGATPGAARLRAALDEFTSKHGHRGLRETDFRSPNWRERPADVLAHLRHHLAPSQDSPVEMAARQRARSEAARARLIGALPKWRQGYARAIVESARKHIAARETTKDLALRFVDLTRRVIAEAARRVGDRITATDDVHFLVASELASALRGQLSAQEIATIVTRRRRDLSWSEQTAAPKVRDGLRATPLVEAVTATQTTTLRGVAVSPGVIEGRARVVLHPSHAMLEPGDVLVAPVTDVAWTPLFLRASALVVEVGGPLSHGSIVAREFGLPAVTAVTGATTSIRDGDRVRVDGALGTVAVIERAR